MAKSHDPLAAKLVTASLEFHRLRLWLELAQDSAFLIRLPDEPHPIVAMVMGQGGEHFGLSLYRGPGGIEAARGLILSDFKEVPSVPDGAVHLSVSFERLERIPAERRTILVDAGFTARREALAPLFIALLPNGRPRLPNRTEMRLMTMVLNTVIRARTAAPLESGRIESDSDLFSLRVVDEPGRPPSIVREREVLPPIDAAFRSRMEAAKAARDDSDESIIDAPPTPAAEPKTLEDWKAVELALAKGMESLLFGGGEIAERACAEYFGDHQDGIEEMRRRPSEAAVAFGEWYAANWRDQTHKTTLVERWLEQATSPAVRRLLDERRRSRPRFYRVDATDPNSMRVDLVDVATGQPTTMLDRGFAKTAELGIIVPLCLLETDVGKFCTIAGPPLRPFEFDEALAFLERHGVSLSRGVEDRPEVLGRLFVWQTARRQSLTNSPQLQNTDGDPLVLHVVTFSFADRAAVVSTLAAHREIERDESPDTAAGVDDFVWLRTTAKGKKALGGPTVYGRMTVKATELTLEVNSDRRLKLARKMLESIRGVRFVRDEVKPFKPPTSASRPVNRPTNAETENDPALLDTLRTYLHERNMAWLDTRVPMLGNRTPRAVARTKEGRERVAMMIRTMPAIPGPGGISIEPPRAEMLREIGVEDP
jgi:hypothetical protein